MYAFMKLCNLFLDTTRIWDNPYFGQIRLTGGNYSNQGLLEVYCNGQWGTVYVMMDLELLMLEWLVNSWDIVTTLTMIIYQCKWGKNAASVI